MSSQTATDVRSILTGSALEAEDGPSTSADRLAAEQWSANFAALSRSQPRLAAALNPRAVPLSWTFGRDGSLTARLAAGRWWAGCSLPLRAGRQMLKNFELVGAVGCFLEPIHGSIIKAAFDRLTPDQAIIAVIPDPLAAKVILSCEDFSGEISAHRLFLATGFRWSETLSEIFQENPGLPIPAQFIRTPLLAQESLDLMVAHAQKALSDAVAAGTERVVMARARAEIRTIDPKNPRRICVVAGSRLRLADLASPILAETLVGDDPRWTRLDCDDPAHASPAALAFTAEDCDLLITANCGRSDFPDVTSARIPWISWITNSRIPALAPGAINDLLLLADPSLRPRALKSGWSANRIFVAAWPLAASHSSSDAEPRAISLITDTIPLTIPQRVKDFSSQSLLWEMIESEIQNNPLCLAGNPDSYLDRAKSRLHVTDEGFDRALFMNKLILPAYHQSLARALLAAQIPLKIHGFGWDALDEFRPHHAGMIAHLADLHRAAADSAALLNSDPSSAAGVHLLTWLGRPILRPQGRHLDAFLRKVRESLSAQTPVRPTAALSTPTLSRQLILDLLTR